MKSTPIAASSARAPGTCGELVQGWIEGAHFHITCPIDIYATARVELFEGPAGVRGPSDCPKALQAVRLTLETLGVSNLAAHLSVESPLPRGKGMASSTADVAAAIAATGAALGKTLSPDEIAGIALRVEPSDGLMFPGIALFDHKHGTHRELLGEPPPMCVLVLDFAGAVDTLEFNAHDLSSALKEREPRWREAAGLVRQGIRQGDLRDIGLGATLDSLAFAEIVPRPQLQAVLALAKEAGALGINTAHSGMVMGLLLPPDGEVLARARRLALERFPPLEGAYPCTLVGGGVL